MPHLRHVVLLVITLVSCADVTLPAASDGSDADIGGADMRLEPADDAEDPDVALPDAGEPGLIPCTEPNPTRFGESGTYCVHHLNGSCGDFGTIHVCVGDYWQCPAEMILVRDCKSFGYPPPDSGMADLGSRDIGGDGGG